MNLYNIKDKSEQVSFAQAVRQGLGREQGLFFPETLEPLADVDALLDLPLAERSARILSHLLGDEVPAWCMSCRRRFHLPAPLVKLKDGTYALELFHGPTLGVQGFRRPLHGPVSGCVQNQRQDHHPHRHLRRHRRRRGPRLLRPGGD
jgi:threonine synthase